MTAKLQAMGPYYNCAIGKLWLERGSWQVLKRAPQAFAADGLVVTRGIRPAADKRRNHE
jgi:hypothetical protein